MEGSPAPGLEGGLGSIYHVAEEQPRFVMLPNRFSNPNVNRTVAEADLTDPG